MAAGNTDPVMYQDCLQGLFCRLLRMKAKMLV